MSMVAAVMSGRTTAVVTKIREQHRDGLSTWMAAYLDTYNSGKESR